MHFFDTKRNSHGFSLVEVMIGMLILSMILLACIISVPRLRELSYQSDATRLAFTQLNAEIESYRTQTFEQMATLLEDEDDSQNNFDLLNKLLGRGTETAEDKVYHNASQSILNGVTYDIDSFLEHYYDDDDEVIQLTVIVEWTYLGKTDFVSSMTIFSEDGLSDKKFAPAN